MSDSKAALRSADNATDGYREAGPKDVDVVAAFVPPDQLKNRRVRCKAEAAILADADEMIEIARVNRAACLAAMGIVDELGYQPAPMRGFDTDELSPNEVKAAKDRAAHAARMTDGGGAKAMPEHSGRPHTRRYASKAGRDAARYARRKALRAASGKVVIQRTGAARAGYTPEQMQAYAALRSEGASIATECLELCVELGTNLRAVSCSEFVGLKRGHYNPSNLSASCTPEILQKVREMRALLLCWKSSPGSMPETLRLGSNGRRGKMASDLTPEETAKRLKLSAKRVARRAIERSQRKRGLH